MGWGLPPSGWSAGYRRAATVAALALCCTAAFRPAAAGATTYGVNYSDFAEPAIEVAPESDIASLEGWLGAKVDRIDVLWSGIQKYGPGSWRWSNLDEMYAADVSRGITPLFVVSHAPVWAWPSDDTCPGARPTSGDGGCDVPPDPNTASTLANWRDFISALVTRYPMVAGVEIWNEPNTDAQWQTSTAGGNTMGGAPGEYLTVLRNAYQAVQGAEPSVGHDVPVVTGSMHLIKTTDKAHTSPIDWMSTLYARGAAGSYDKIGYHAYTVNIPSAPNDNAFVQLASVEALAGQDDPSDPGVWVTETGYSTTKPCWVDGVEHSPCTEADQARGLPLIVSRLASDPQVEMVLVFTLIDIKEGERTPPELGYGLIHRDLTPKASYCTLSLQWTGVDACADDDGDGLTNVKETDIGTDPHNPDTDGDGTLDGADSKPLDRARAGAKGVAPAIVSGPSGFVTTTDVSFTFSSSLQGPQLQCPAPKLDGAAYGACASPRAYTSLSNGQHTFSVRAVDADGIAGQAAGQVFNLDTKPPQTTINSGPSGSSISRSATFKFSSSEAGTFECSLDLAAFTPCTSPRGYSGLTSGHHSFAGRAIDRAGNVDQTPAIRNWSVL